MAAIDVSLYLKFFVGLFAIINPLGLLPVLTGALEGQLLRDQPGLNPDKFREAVAGDWTCNARRIRRELGFIPAAPLVERIGHTAQWYRAAGWL